MILLLFAVWLILNGKVTIEILAFGIVITLAVFAFMCKFMDYNIKKEVMAIRIVPSLLAYLVVLIVEIVKANVATVSLVVNQKVEAEPRIVHFKVPLRTKFCRMLLANSITLTPGTITVEVHQNEYCVHCLDVDFSEGMEDSVFVKRLMRMEEIMFGEKEKQ